MQLSLSLGTHEAAPVGCIYEEQRNPPGRFEEEKFPGNKLFPVKNEGNSRGELLALSDMTCRMLRSFSAPYAEDVSAVTLYHDVRQTGTNNRVISGSCKGWVKIHVDDGSGMPNCKAELKGVLYLQC